jgi:hypothetical protein
LLDVESPLFGEGFLLFASSEYPTPWGVGGGKLLFFSELRFPQTAKYSFQMVYGQIFLSKWVMGLNRKSPILSGIFYALYPV